MTLQEDINSILSKSYKELRDIYRTTECQIFHLVVSKYLNDPNHLEELIQEIRKELPDFVTTSDDDDYDEDEWEILSNEIRSFCCTIMNTLSKIDYFDLKDFKPVYGSPTLYSRFDEWFPGRIHDVMDMGLLKQPKTEK